VRAALKDGALTDDMPFASAQGGGRFADHGGSAGKATKDHLHMFPFLLSPLLPEICPRVAEDDRSEALHPIRAVASGEVFLHSERSHSGQRALWEAFLGTDRDDYVQSMPCKTHTSLKL
jgi:hypothetical protein